MEELKQYFVNFALEVEDKTSSSFVAEKSIKVSDKTVQRTTDVCMENPSLSLDDISNGFQKDFADKSQFLNPEKYITMKEDGSIEIINRENDKADLNVSQTIELTYKEEAMEQDSQKYKKDILKSDVKLSDLRRETIAGGDPSKKSRPIREKNKVKDYSKIIKGFIDKVPTVVKNINKTPVEKLTCEYCKKVFITFNNKHNHLRYIHKVTFSEAEKHSVELRTCEYCQKIFLNSHSKYRHLKNIHKVNPRNKDPSEKIYPCGYCRKTFTNACSKNRHIKIVHKLEIPVVGDIRCIECDKTFRRIQQLRDHLESYHGSNMLSQELRFPNMNAFKKWKCEIERQSLCYYYMRHGSPRNRLGPKKYYGCHRSARYLPKPVENRKRMLKAAGSCKMEITCTSAISCHIIENEVIVHYYPNHYGHGNATTFVQLSNEEQIAIQESVSNGISYEQLLDDMKDNQSKDDFQLLYLKKRDLRWINSALNAQEFNLDISDAESVENWVRRCCKMEDSPVLFYQQKDIGSDQEEFMLVIMTEFQKHILISAKKNVVCVDSLHRRKGHRFYLTVLFVMDEFDHAFPVAFCISNRVDKSVIEQFFLSIKDTAGILSFKHFMSDQENFLYESWVAVMNDKPRWLWSMWYVDFKIQTQFNIFKGNTTKREEVYKTVKKLLLCQNEMMFKCMFKNFIENLTNNPLTQKLSKFIIDKYGSNTEMWALCYRQEVDLSTNNYLEVMHRTFRYCCREGRKKRLDKFLYVVMKLIKCKMLDRVSNMLDEEKMSLTNKAISMCHSAGLDIPASSMSALSENIWLIESGDDEGPLYVTKDFEKCPEHCSLRCDDCDICVHQYSCTCVHSMVEANLCMHIHAVVWKFLTPRFSPIPSPAPSPNGYEKDILLKPESTSPSSKGPDLFDDVLKRSYDVCKNLKQNRCNLNKKSLNSIMKRLNECVDVCLGKKLKVTKPLKATPPVTSANLPITSVIPPMTSSNPPMTSTPNTATIILDSYVEGEQYVLPHPIQALNSGAETQYVLLIPTNGENVTKKPKIT